MTGHDDCEKCEELLQGFLDRELTEAEVWATDASDDAHGAVALPSAQAYLMTFAAITACAAAGVVAALALPLRTLRPAVA